jgi:hypothetical protein
VLTLVLIGAAAAAGGGFVAYRVGKARGRAGGEPNALPAGPAKKVVERTLRDVTVDDVLQQGGRDWLVEGLVQYDEDGHTWRAARVIDAADERWFLIGLERQSDLTVRMLTVVKGLELTGYPPDTLVVDSVSYKLSQRGTATTTTAGALGDIPISKVAGSEGKVGRCRWWRYAAAGDKTLIVEQWGDIYRAMTGALIAPADVDLLAGS